jgi:hypothetical protein
MLWPLNILSLAKCRNSRARLLIFYSIWSDIFVVCLDPSLLLFASIKYSFVLPLLLIQSAGVWRILLRVIPIVILIIANISDVLGNSWSLRSFDIGVTECSFRY